MVNRTIRIQQARKFVSTWQLFQERYQVVSRSYSSSISLLELSILIEADIDPTRSQIELSRLFHVSPQSMSRALANLQTLKFVESHGRGKDRRVKRFQLSPDGMRELRKIDDEANLLLEEMTDTFEAEEKDRLVAILSVLEDFFPIERATTRAVDHPLRGPIRTFTRGFGLLGNAAFGVAEVTTFEWHVLTAIQAGLGNIRALDLAVRFRAPKNSVSVLLSRLEAERLIEKKSPNAGDKRSRFLKILPKGRKVLQDIEAKSTELLLQAMKPLSDVELFDLSGLMERLIRPHTEHSVTVRFTVKPYPTKEERGGIQGVYADGILIACIAGGSPQEISSQQICEALGGKKDKL